jgi:hypothetical protein
MVPKENLLEYRMGQGWQPLCDFLQVPMPIKTKFPHVNDTDGFVERCRRRNRAQLMNVLLRMAVLGITLIAVVLGVGITVNLLFGDILRVL